MLVIALCLLVVTGANCELPEPHPDVQRVPSDGRVEVNLGSEVILNSLSKFDILTEIEFN